MPTPDPAEEARRLGDRVNGHPEHVADALPRLVALLTHDDPQVVEAAVDALGHACHPAAASALLDRVPLDHPHPGVRLGLAQALPGGVEEGGTVHGRVADALVVLTRDGEPRVRDWAAFGLGQLPATSPRALDALAALLDDPDRDARCEALLALAAAGDDRARPVLLARLDAADDDLTLLELTAAGALTDPVLHPALERLAAAWGGDEDAFTAPLRTALDRCHPDAPDRARRVERDVLARVREALPAATTVALRGSYPRTVLVVGPDDALRLDLWADGETPTGHDAARVVNAVLGSVPPGGPRG